MNFEEWSCDICMQDLPPIEDLHIAVGENVQFTEIGKVSSVVDVLVVVQSNVNVPPLDEDTILFLQDKTVLGKIFETFGPVSCPLYSVRFNSVQHISEHGIEVGAAVFCVPNVSEWTHYIFLEHVRAMLGSDASWRNDNEPPEWRLDYSDDETEQRAKAKLRMRRFVKEEDSGDVEDDDSSSSPDVDASLSPQKTTKCQRHKQYSTRRLNTSTWPPRDRPYRGRGHRFSRGRSSISFDRGRGHSPRTRTPRRFTTPPTFPPSFVPPSSSVPIGPYVFPPPRLPSVPPPPGLTPPRFIPPPLPQSTQSSSSFVSFPPPRVPNPSIPPPALVSCPATLGPPQPWTFGMLPPFPPPFPPPPVSNALLNCWNRPPPPLPPPPPPLPSTTVPPQTDKT